MPIKIGKTFFGSLQYIAIPPCFRKNWCLRILLTQAPAQICLINFYIPVTTLIRNSHKKIITCININDVYDFFIGSHKRSQRDERLYTGNFISKGIYDFKAIIFYILTTFTLINFFFPSFNK